MIIDDSHGAAFVHIPKNGGTTISLQLEAVDSYAGAFRRKGAHPRLGAVHYAHLPLAFLETEFRDVFDKVAAYQSFAVSRDPHARFASAVFQRLEEFRGVPKVQVTAELALQEARDIVRWLERRESFCDLEYIHFSRQVDYVELRHQPVVRNVFALEHGEALIAALENAFRVKLDPRRRENTNFASGGRTLALLRRAKPLYSRLTPWAFREQVLLFLKRLNLRQPDGLYSALRDDAGIRRFVEDYYREDFRLHERALASGPMRANQDLERAA